MTKDEIIIALKKGVPSQANYSQIYQFRLELANGKVMTKLVDRILQSDYDRPVVNSFEHIRLGLERW